MHCSFVQKMVEKHLPHCFCTDKFLCKNWLKVLSLGMGVIFRYNECGHSFIPITVVQVLSLHIYSSLYRKVLMFTTSELKSLRSLTDGKYVILIANAHDITISSLLTGHEWIIVSDYGNTSCSIRHRHSRVCPFHRQRGIYPSMKAALDYIEEHDRFFASKQAGRRVPSAHHSV